ncbi:TIGR02679 family protein [Planomonospora sp. ID82291]|uniref:TIGR02679 family protein n=1 Tax=Planomonospora sp. ID82291 TaxID=2738136 RepID=UPI0018C3AB66|nr:TIGR02679 family protein [Planomonospora sp. ID82291]MBG0813124.1 TIGR02679 family protein [Planomonospora sp. ID82291]
MSGRLERLLGGPETAWLVERARRRLERGRPLHGPVTLDAAAPEQRRAIERLLGRRAGAGASLSVSLDEVDRVLRSSGACPEGLAAAVVLLRGPVRDLGRESAEREAAWREAFTELDAVLADRPELSGWRSWLETTGLVRRSTDDPREARALLGTVAALLLRLPHPGIPIGRLAAEVCGDAHALDEGRPSAALALSAVRALGGLPPGDGTADARRRAWAAVGVHLDDLSSTVLCLGLPGDDRTPTGRVLAAAGAAGEPCVLTLRQLRRHDSPLRAGPVRICENPVVVAAAADELGPRCPPLVCTGGRPSAAVWRLLDLLAAGGAEFAYHGDFDWGGVGIAHAVRERIGWRPWRYDAVSYEAALRAAGTGAGSATASAAGGTARSGTSAGPRTAVPAPPLSGRPRATPWDPGLSAAMARHAVRVEEETVLGTLLADLAAEPGDAAPR